MNNRSGAAADTERRPLAGEPTLEPNPLISAEEMEEGHEAAAIAYRYRKVRALPLPLSFPSLILERIPPLPLLACAQFELSGDITLVARTTIHAVSRKGGSAKYVAAYSLHEWDPRKSGVPEYRRTLEAQVRRAGLGARSRRQAGGDCFRPCPQRGALLATEIKNNAAKLARFTIASLLAGAHALKLGFVSRAAKADSNAHQVRRAAAAAAAPP